MAKAEASAPPPSTYVTGFCGVGKHERCPAIIKNNVGGRVWECHCRCHAEGNTGWEPPVMDVSTEAWNAIWAAQESNGNGHHATSAEFAEAYVAPLRDAHLRAQERWSPTLLALRDLLERAL